MTSEDAPTAPLKPAVDRESLKMTLKAFVIPEGLNFVSGPVDGPDGQVWNELVVRGEAGAARAANYFINAGCKSVYVGLNPVYRPRGMYVANVDVIKRRWFLVDVDPGSDDHPVTPPSSDADLARTISTASAVKGMLAKFGFPKPCEATSGNGTHLLYRCELPNVKESDTLLRTILRGLSACDVGRHTTVDQKVYDAKRITKFYGTVPVKGDPTPERPLRASRWTSFDPDVEVVTEDAWKAAFETFYVPRERTNPVVGPKGASRSRVFDIRPRDVFPELPESGHCPSPIHGSDSGRNSSVNPDGTLLRCWKCDVSLPGWKLLLVKAGYTCEEASEASAKDWRHVSCAVEQAKKGGLM